MQIRPDQMASDRVTPSTLSSHASPNLMRTPIAMYSPTDHLQVTLSPTDLYAALNSHKSSRSSNHRGTADRAFPLAHLSRLFPPWPGRPSM